MSLEANKSMPLDDLPKLPSEIAEEMVKCHDLKHVETIEKNILPSKLGYYYYSFFFLVYISNLNYEK